MNTATIRIIKDKHFYNSYTVRVEVNPEFPFAPRDIVGKCLSEYRRQTKVWAYAHKDSIIAGIRIWNWQHPSDRIDKIVVVAE